MLKISALCKEKQLGFHLDGARLFNALVETKESTIDVGNAFDSISICLSKGLGAPVGSLLLGTTDFIKKARRVRKVFGGGMRQAGFLAAAGIYALDNNVNRLTEDHKRAKHVETILTGLPYVETILPVDTNIIIFNLSPNLKLEVFESKLKEQGIKMSAFGKQTVRFVTHLDFTDEMLMKLESVLKGI
jgi:threonine aldolase